MLTSIQSTKKKLFTGLIALSAALFLTGCFTSSDDDDAAMETPMEEKTTIAAIASSNEDFQTLTAALTAADLVTTLEGEGPFTVFAPTDAAFEALPAGTVEALLQDPQGDLKNILLYHVVSGAVRAETVVTLDNASTVFGQDVSVKVIGGEVFLNENIKVVITDIEASNGIIHVIDGVLIPE